MTRWSEFVFAAPLAFVLLVWAPAALVALFASNRRRPAGAENGTGAGAGPRRLLGGLLFLAVLFLVAGLGACGWILLGTTAEPETEPLFLAGLTALGLVPALAALALWLQRRQRPVFRFPGLRTLRGIREGRPGLLRWAPPVLRLAALLLVGLALARPQVATTETDVFTEGMDIIVTLDVSTSMEAVDFAPPGRRQRKSRIQGAKEVIRRFVEQRSDDRLGLVIFAAEAYTQCPLSLDYSIMINILRSIRTGVIEDGTAIGDAIVVSINRLRDSEVKSKAIILLTDGDDNASQISPVQAAEIAAQKGIRIFPVLVGKGGKVDYPVGPSVFGRMRYRKVEIRTNPELLKKIATIAEGKFYRAVDQKSLAEDFQDILDEMEKSRLMDPGRFTRHTEVFQLALLPALLALLLELALRWTRLRRFP